MLSIRRSLAGALATAALIAVSGAASAIPFSDRQVLVDNSTLGFYNTGLGRLLDRPAGNNTGIFPCDYQGSDVCVADPTVPAINEAQLNSELAAPAVAAVLGNWLTLNSSNTLAPGAAPTGTGWSASPQAIPVNWPIQDERAIVYEFGIDSPSWTEVELHLGVDNGIMVWLDGQYLMGAMAGGSYGESEYVMNLADIGQGTHYLQVLLEDHGGLDGFSIGLRGTPVQRTAALPEPAPFALLGLGLIGLGVARRRKTA